MCIVGFWIFFQEFLKFLCGNFIFAESEVERSLFNTISDLVWCHVGGDTMDMWGWGKGCFVSVKRFALLVGKYEVAVLIS